jgi:hypothetical protein
MPPPRPRRLVKRKNQRTDADQLADYAARLLEITAELCTELLTVIDVLRTVQARFMDRIYKARP